MPWVNKCPVPGVCGGGGLVGRSEYWLRQAVCLAGQAGAQLLNADPDNQTKTLLPRHFLRKRQNTKNK